MERRTCWQNCFGPGGDESFLSDAELLAINVNLSPLCDRLRTISNTLKAFWGPDRASHDIDRELLSILGEPTNVKRWLAASLDKTIRLHLHIQERSTGR